MAIEDKRNQVTALIDSIKEHSDQLKEYERVPLLELSVILSKITQLHEKVLILKYLSATEQHRNEERRESFASIPSSTISESPEKKEEHVSEIIEAKEEPISPSMEEEQTLADAAEEKPVANSLFDPIFTEQEEEEETESDEETKEVSLDKEQESAEELAAYQQLVDKIENSMMGEDTTAQQEEEPLAAAEEEESAENEETEPKGGFIEELAGVISKMEEGPEEVHNEHEINDVEENTFAVNAEEDVKPFEADEIIKEEPTPQEEDKEELTALEKLISEEPAISIDEVEANEEIVGKPDLNEAFSETEDTSLSNQLQKQPITDLLAAIGLNERYLYANELFDGDMEAFRQATGLLNTFESLEEAKNFFDQELRSSYNWEDKVEMVNAFYTLVERRYL